MSNQYEIPINNTCHNILIDNVTIQIVYNYNYHNHDMLIYGISKNMDKLAHMYYDLVVNKRSSIYGINFNDTNLFEKTINEMLNITIDDDCDIEIVDLRFYNFDWNNNSAGLSGQIETQPTSQTRLAIKLTEKINSINIDTQLTKSNKRFNFGYNTVLCIGIDSIQTKKPICFVVFLNTLNKHIKNAYLEKIASLEKKLEKLELSKYYIQHKLLKNNENEEININIEEPEKLKKTINEIIHSSPQYILLTNIYKKLDKYITDNQIESEQHINTIILEETKMKLQKKSDDIKNGIMTADINDIPILEKTLTRLENDIKKINEQLNESKIINTRKEHLMNLMVIKEMLNKELNNQVIEQNKN